MRFLEKHKFKDTVNLKNLLYEITENSYLFIKKNNCLFTEFEQKQFNNKKVFFNKTYKNQSLNVFIFSVFSKNLQLFKFNLNIWKNLFFFKDNHKIFLGSMLKKQSTGSQSFDKNGFISIVSKSPAHKFLRLQKLFLFEHCSFLLTLAANSVFLIVNKPFFRVKSKFEFQKLISRLLKNSQKYSFKKLKNNKISKVRLFCINVFKSDSVKLIKIKNAKLLEKFFLHKYIF
uniref:Uncharacterized protein n=1 Tax=Aureoumbra lagunensis TaxID=44058 RepID=A0A7U0KRK6_9STRA|nr:hypothetical protein K4Z71_mgp06 [Aureoumbra lagunensis]QQW50420.1 hypothetical protein [Aureoumbra lagunensis]